MGIVDANNFILWQHKSTLSSYDVTLNNKRVNVYNIIFALNESTAPPPMNTIIHEYKHILGFTDLYRDKIKVTPPVSIWDMMASNRDQFSLTANVARYTNWIDINKDFYLKDTVGKTTYKLTPTTKTDGNEDGKIAVKIQSPISATEYFIVEYRKKDYKNTVWDKNIPGSGIIVYRVNTTTSGNYNGPPDEFFVFSPGNILKAHMSSNEKRTGFGSADFSATDPNKVLVHSNGQNSGIVISDVGAADDTITFSVTITDPNKSKIDKWVSTSTNLTIGAKVEARYFTNNVGDDYVFVNNATGTMTLNKLSDSNNKATAIAQFAFGSNVQVAESNNILYVAYVNRSKNVEAKKISLSNTKEGFTNLVNNSPEVTTSIAVSENMISLAVNVSDVFVAIGKTKGSAVVRIRGGVVTILTNKIQTSYKCRGVELWIDGGEIYVLNKLVYSNDAMLGVIYEFKGSDNTWKQPTKYIQLDPNPDGISFTIANNTIYAFIRGVGTNSLSIGKWNSNSFKWEYTPLNTKGTSIAITTTNNVPIIAFGMDGIIQSKILSGTSWKNVGVYVSNYRSSTQGNIDLTVSKANGFSTIGYIKADNNFALVKRSGMVK
ncbi:MAG TPA: hypothetical protein VIK78_15220 [Ruminiclostridium sp.]